MAALTETSSTLTEFTGKVKAKIYLIDGASTGTVTVAEFSTICGAFTQLAEASTANCKGYATAVSSNIATCSAIKGDGSLGTSTLLDFYLLVIGY